MKYLLIILGLFGLINKSNAQLTTLTVKAGLNLSSMTSTNNGLYQAKQFTWQNEEVKNITGYHVGIFSEKEFKSFALQVGVQYIKKGGRNDVYYTKDNYSYHSSETLNLNCVELPVNIVVHLPYHNGKFFIGGGPYLDLFFSGTDKNPLVQTRDNKVTTSSVDYDVVFGKNDKGTAYVGVIPNGVNNPSYGLNALAGFKLSDRLSFSANYSLSLTKVSLEIGSTARLKVVGFSAGYTFL